MQIYFKNLLNQTSHTFAMFSIINQTNHIDLRHD